MGTTSTDEGHIMNNSAVQRSGAGIASKKAREVETGSISRQAREAMPEIAKAVYEASCSIILHELDGRPVRGLAATYDVEHAAKKYAADVPASWVVAAFRCFGITPEQVKQHTSWNPDAVPDSAAPAKPVTTEVAEMILAQTTARATGLSHYSGGPAIRAYLRRKDAPVEALLAYEEGQHPAPGHNPIAREGGAFEAGFDPFDPMAWMSAWGKTLADASARSGLTLAGTDAAREPGRFRANAMRTLVNAQMAGAAQMLLAAMGGLGRTPEQRGANFFNAWTGGDIFG